jgi:hypothetical protein
MTWLTRRDRLRQSLIAAVTMVGVAAVTCAASAADVETPSTAMPTFSKDVAPILFAHCTACHRAGSVGAAMPLTTYADVYPRAAAIERAVVARSMPPWPFDSAHSLKMRNDPELSARDIDVIVRWVDNGAAAGDPADLPPVPEAPRHWAHPQGLAPDLVLSLPPIRVPATGEIAYTQQRIAVPVKHDRWVTAIQVLTGNYDVVHHMAITEVVDADGLTADQLDTFAQAAQQLGIPSSALATQSDAVIDPIGGAPDMFGVYTPGTTFEMYPAGSAKLLRAGPKTYMNFNLHFTTTGKPEISRAQLGLWFSSGTPRRQLFRAPAAVATLIANGRQLLTDDPGTKAEGTDVAIPPIAPYEAHYELIGMTAYTEPVTIYQLQPHAHMRAKDFHYAVVYPDGREVDVLTVPNFDFHWQLAYDLETPLRLPAGSKLIVTAHYDNSADNPHLRELGSADLARHCGPDKHAYFRRENQSWDEMFTPLVQFAEDDLDPRKPGTAGGRGTHATLPLVEAVGCLVGGAQRGWRLERAGAPVATSTQSTSAAALKSGAGLARGDQRYGLLGVDAFHPEAQNARAVSVKGVLIGNPGNLINVTSLQPMGSCR